VRLRGATPPHRQLLLVLERPRELTEPNRAARHPDHPPTTTVTSTPLRTGARASRSSAPRPVTRWPDSRLRGRRLLGAQRCTPTSRVRPLRSRGRYGSGGLRLNIRVQHSFGRASRLSQRAPSRGRPPAGASDRPKAPQCPASESRVSPGPSRALTTPTRPPSGCSSFVGVPRQPQPAPFPFGRT
jgi:hypothetical protein